MWHMHIANLAMDITTVESTTPEDIHKAYTDIHKRLVGEGAPIEQLRSVATSFQTVMKRKTDRELPTATATDEGVGD